MNCIFRTRGEPPVSGFTLTISGTPDASYGYVSIGETKYSAAQTVSLPAGSEVGVYVGGRGSSSLRPCYIYLNGTLVQSGTGTYTFSLTGNAEITFTAQQVSAASGYRADISM